MNLYYVLNGDNNRCTLLANNKKEVRIITMEYMLGNARDIRIYKIDFINIIIDICKEYRLKEAWVLLRFWFKLKLMPNVLTSIDIEDITEYIDNVLLNIQ